MGQYDAILDEEKGATAPAANASPYDTVLDQEVQQNQQRVRTIFEKALAVNPDQAAQAQRLAANTGLPADTVTRNLDEVKRKDQARMLDIAQMAQDSPVLAYQLMNPEFTNQAHDDIGTLSAIGQFFSDTGGSMKAGVFNASKGSAGVFRAGLELVAPLLDPLESVTSIGGNPLRRLAEGFGKLGDDAGATAKAAAPKTDGILSGGFQSGIQSLTQNLLAMPMAFMPGGQGAALTMMTANTGGQSYQDAREKGLSMSQALPFAASQAAIEFATEKIPLGDLIRDLKVGAPIIKLLTNQLKGEVIGEQIATVLQDLNEWAVLNPEKPFADYIAERPNAAAQTLIATIVGTGGNVAIAKGVEAATKKLMGDAYDAGQADIGSEQLKNALNLATKSKLRERNPEEFRTLVQKMAERTDGAPTEVFVDAEVLNQLAPEVLAQLPGVAEQMQAALAANDVVSIPVADVLTVAPGTPLEAMLVENARIGDPRSMSQAEAKEAGAKAQEYLAQESQRVIQQAADQQAMQDSSDRVRQGVLDQLNTVGRFRKDVNEAYATWTAAFYTTMAGRMGITPEEMQAKYPLRVVGQDGAGDVLRAAQTDPLLAQATGVPADGPNQEVAADDQIEPSDDTDVQISQGEVPPTVDDVAGLGNTLKMAASKVLQKGRDLKMVMQDAVQAAARAAGVDVSAPSPQSRDYLVRVGVKDALVALEQNANAVGWYDLKTRQALAVMALVHPEIATDERARMAFVWAMAVTSNGLKVEKNFEIAEKVYRGWKAVGRGLSQPQRAASRAAASRMEFRGGCMRCHSTAPTTRGVAKVALLRQPAAAAWPSLAGRSARRIETPSAARRRRLIGRVWPTLSAWVRLPAQPKR